MIKARLFPSTAAFSGRIGRRSPAFWQNLLSSTAIAAIAGTVLPCASAVAQVAANASDAVKIETVTVTAQKKEENQQDVPIPLTVLSSDDLAQTGQTYLKDFASSVPGFDAAPNVNGIQALVIRGIATSGLDTPSVGVVIDDVPFGAQSNGSADEIPEIDPGDLDHIEVLRGPQGTLYGANAMGGLLKYVTKSPTMDDFNGRLEVGASSVYNGAEPGFVLRGSANIPISSDFAVRVSGFTRQDPGYIDDPALHLRGVNQGEDDGFRVASLWQVVPNLSLKLSALYQKSRANGTSEADALPGLGDLQQQRLPNTGAEYREVQAYSAEVNGQLGGVNLVSLTGFNSNDFTNTYDYTATLGKAALNNFGVSGGSFLFHLVTHKVSEEVRATGTLFDHLDWLVGGYYTGESKPGYLLASAVNPQTGNIAGVLGISNQHPGSAGAYSELSAFGNLTYRFDDQFDIQLGGRESHIIVYNSPAVSTGIFANVSPLYKSSDDTLTYSITPEYKISPDAMVYARIATGFRPGSANTALTISKGAPALQTPDQTTNYEVGTKAQFFDDRLSVDASLYYINWKNIQLTLSTPDNFTYASNGGAAKSEGVELSVTAIPVKGLSLTGWATYQDAELTTAFPSNSLKAVGQSGDRLPFSSRFSSYIAATKSVSLTNTMDGFFTAAFNYIGDRVGPFGGSETRQIFPAYTKVNLSTGVDFDNWTATAYVDNVANTRGLVNGGIFYAGPSPAARIYITPRTFGMSLVKNF